MKHDVCRVRAAVAGAFFSSLALLCAAPFVHGQNRPGPQKLAAGPRATPLRVTWLYISPSTSAQKIDRVQIGREMVVTESSGPWLRVYANTDAEELVDQRDVPAMGDDSTPPPISGWMQAKGIVQETTPGGDQILMGAAASEETLAADPHGPLNAAQSARLLYMRAMEMFPNSPLAPEARWRAADILWQLQKADASTLPSAKSRDPYMRELMDETQLRKVIKLYPGTRWAAQAAFDLIDNKLCGSWQGLAKCPEKEEQVYEKYADDYPNGPRTARALYEAVYRLAVLTNMFAASKDTKKSDGAHQYARKLAQTLKDHFANSDYALRAEALIYKLDQGIPVYGIDQP